MSGGSPVDVAALEAQLEAMRLSDHEALDAILRLAEVVFPDGRGMGSRERLLWPTADRASAPAGFEDDLAVSERDQLAADIRRSDVRFRSLVEQVPAVVFSAALGDADNEIYVSPHIESVLGFTQKEWLTNPLLWYSQLHPDDHDVVIDAFTRGVQTGGPFRAEVRFFSRRGEEVWILGEARLIRDDAGRLAYFQGVGFDITPTKRAQAMMAEAAQLRAELYTARNVELAELNEQLRVAVEQASAAEAMQRQLLIREREVVERLTRLDRDKTDFVSSVSHELRTPVTSMLGYLEMLTDGDAGPLNDQQLRMLHVINRNSRRLLNRIEDLLTVSGLEAGKMRLALAPLAVPALVESAVAAVAPAMAGRDLKVTTHVSPDATVIVADAEHLDRVVINLLSNAVKFTPDGGRISVTVTRRGDMVELAVADTGVGIPEDEQPRVFERFFRSSNAQEMAIAGTGLGLVIVKGIVDLHGGTVTLRSTPGLGTEVTIVLPARTELDR
ncbi:MAG TPA: ATP-binding protein [Acidimicrobiales bacterium]